ncbi:transmembrane protein, putative (macronuclear) [Tetrahymena thermophila SB210]|uniref:Transmembrane protein, putative n=1 Tax=Tetrahymena thermophila (strain SB210) TaxID=312017 RepID=I7M0T6_TETTS|nr:transmembrane protein, putative [Tetrahymena thermophila SB210]EAR90914.1 transmembrane protein, putative [Tetrahymena thermophila SB210]|eukprot:XP_001011159.1 transmembrane protein, putative [Tetrahymena thermophila SB210]
MYRQKGETPTQILTRHIVFLFYLIFVALHISLGYYYFEAEGSNYKPLVGFLSYVKDNVESMPIQNIQVVFQDILTRDSSKSQSIYRWAGSSSGYLCDNQYQSSQCSSTTVKAVQLYDTNVRNFYYLPGTYTLSGSQVTQSASFILNRCPSSGCPASTTPNPTKPSQFTIQQDPATKNYYIYINGQKDIQAYQLYKIFLGISDPCMNEDYNSFLPSTFQMPIYKLQNNDCGTFGTIPNLSQVTQSTDPKNNDATISLDIKQIFLYNEMQITLSDLGRPFSSIQSGMFNMYFIPKINYSTNSQNCVVSDDLSSVPHYSHQINQTGLAMFIIRQVFMVFLLPIPIIEMALGFLKNPTVVFIGFASKGLLILNLLLLVIEGGIVSSYYSKKTSLQNSIRNLGWQGCFDSDTNQKFISFPSVFTSTQDTYNYYAYVYLWISVVGLFIIFLLIIKIVMDMFVKKKKYGEYDSDPMQENQPYDPTVAYMPYQDQQQQFYSGEDFSNGQQNINFAVSQQLPLQTSLVKTPSNRQKLLSTEKRNNLSTIKEIKNAEGSKMQNGSLKQQNLEMQVLSNSKQSESDDEEEED